MPKRTSVAAAVALLVLAGCGSTTAGSGVSANATTTKGGTVAAAQPARPTTGSVPATTLAGLAIAKGDGWTSAGLEGPVPAPGTCHYRAAADGYPLPDPSCTPGAIDPSARQATLRSTICRRGGYTSRVRPPESLTELFKYKTEAAYQDPSSTSRTELDHLVPLELGGASDTRNLWPQPDQGSPGQFDPADPFGRNAKDGVESRLHAAVCAGQIDLASAQRAIAADWTTALARVGR